VVADAGPLIHLDELGSLDLLADYASILVPEAVWHEVTRHRPDAIANRLLALEKVARLAAKALNIEANGTIGIVLRALRRGQRDKHQVLALLESIPTHTSLHLRPSLLAEVIAEVQAL